MNLNQDATYTDAFTGETLNLRFDEVLRVVVSRLDGDVVRQEFYVRRDHFLEALDPQVPLGEVFDNE